MKFTPKLHPNCTQKTRYPRRPKLAAARSAAANFVRRLCRVFCVQLGRNFGVIVNQIDQRFVHPPYVCFLSRTFRPRLLASCTRLASVNKHPSERHRTKPRSRSSDSLPGIFTQPCVHKLLTSEIINDSRMINLQIPREKL